VAVDVPKESFEFLQLIWGDVIVHFKNRTVGPEAFLLASVTLQASANAGICAKAGESDIDDIKICLGSPARFPAAKQNIEATYTGLQFANTGLRNPLMAVLN
jgi:hypothetical protein